MVNPQVAVQVDTDEQEWNYDELLNIPTWSVARMITIGGKEVIKRELAKIWKECQQY